MFSLNVSGCWMEGGQSMRVLLVFFFQAEDGIRDVAVTGVQTCALPISDKTKFEAVEMLRKFEVPCAPVLSMKESKTIRPCAPAAPWSRSTRRSAASI